MSNVTAVVLSRRVGGNPIPPTCESHLRVHTKAL